MAETIRDKSSSNHIKSGLPTCMRRQHARIYKKSPITFTLIKSRNPRQAIMYNEGIGGMYFETDTQLTPGTIIRIQLIEQTPSSSSLGTNMMADTFYTAEVRWCRIISKNGPQKRFGVGVHYYPDTAIQ